MTIRYTGRLCESNIRSDLNADGYCIVDVWVEIYQDRSKWGSNTYDISTC